MIFDPRFIEDYNIEDLESFYSHHYNIIWKKTDTFVAHEFTYLQPDDPINGTKQLGYYVASNTMLSFVLKVEDDFVQVLIKPVPQIVNGQKQSTMANSIEDFGDIYPDIIRSIHSE